ncbi:MAG: hypothetical protein AAGB00_08330 [Planctomycetota bacterium]
MLSAAASGCANRQGVSNPFTTADRVPPPDTRVPVGGAVAQPYYQGQPLQPAPGGGVPLQPAAPPAFGQPGFGAPAPGFAPQGSSPPPAAPAEAAFASNEPMVSVPTDGASLRLAAAPRAVAAPRVVATPTPTALAAAPVQQFIASAPTQPTTFAATRSDAAPATFTSPAFAPPASARPMPVTLSPTGARTTSATLASVTQPEQTDFSPAASSHLPWVSGSAPRSAASAPSGVQPAAYLAPAPRVRLPGYPSPRQTFVAPQGALAPTGRVQITELPPGPATAPPATSRPASSDGFRPRTTFRQAARPEF